MENIRIFFASPSDVAEERLIAYRVIERLRNEFADRADIQAMIWEHEPLLATADFQSQIGAPSAADIFVMMMWGRFGSPLGPQFRRNDGSRYESATQYEFEEAMNAFEADGTPRIIVYRKIAPLMIQTQEDKLQFAAVDRFFEKWFINTEDHTAKAAFHTFIDIPRFEDLLEIHLRKSLHAFLPNPSNIPTPADPFIGREALMAQVSETILSDKVRLVTLVGPGGTGKTRLAMHLGGKLLSQFDDGVVLISLASVTDVERVPLSIASALGLKEPDQAGTSNIVRALKRKRMLLLIDNLEQVQAAGIYLSEILKHCPMVKFIVTSREALRLTGATTIRVPPLALPELDKLPSLAALREIEAISLFLARAQAVRADFELTIENAGHVIEICRRVDALPLAIELAASRVRTMSAERLSQALAQRFKLLTGGADDLLEHQKNLHSLIAWSYDLLDPLEQRLWRRLAIFPDGCSIEAAQVVCDPDDQYFVEVDIEALVDKSLVNINFDARTTDSRISMLESLRAFAQEKLSASAEFTSIQQRFCEWCADSGFADEETTMGSDFEARLAQMDIEQNNLRGALAYATTAAQANTALRICGGHYQHWCNRGVYRQGAVWIEQALALAGDTHTKDIARAHKAMSTLLRQGQRLEESEQHANTAMQISTQLGDNKMRASLYCELGAIAQRRGDFESATNHLNTCIQLARAEEIGDHNLSFFLIVKGISEHMRGELIAAEKSYIEGLSIAQEGGDKTRSANALLNLGEILEVKGDYEQAYAHYRDSLQYWGELRHKAAIARCAEVIAGLEIRVRECPSEAAFLFGAAELIRELIEVPVEPFNQQQVDDDIRATRAAMAQQDCTAAWEAGRALQIGGVLRHVLDNNVKAD